MHTRGFRTKRGAPGEPVLLTPGPARRSRRVSAFEAGQVAAIASDSGLAARIAADPARYAEDLTLVSHLSPFAADIL
jgi:hypothetical protein